MPTLCLAVHRSLRKILAEVKGASRQWRIGGLVPHGTGASELQAGSRRPACHIGKVVAIGLENRVLYLVAASLDASSGSPQIQRLAAHL